MTEIANKLSCPQRFSIFLEALFSGFNMVNPLIVPSLTAWVADLISHAQRRVTFAVADAVWSSTASLLFTCNCLAECRRLHQRCRQRVLLGHLLKALAS